MQRTVDEIFYQITEGLKIKRNSPIEDRFRNKALRIFNQERFTFLKEKVLKLCDLLLRLKIANERQLKKLKHSQNFEQLRDIIMEFFDGFLDILEFVKIENMVIKSEQLKEKEIKLLKREHEQESKSESQKFTILKNEKDSLLKNNKRLEKELNKYRTPAKRIKNKVDAYIDLIKKEPDKIPSPESLADFSKGKEFELGRTRWYDLIKTNNFITNIISALIIEEDKMWEKIGKCKKEIEGIDKKIKSEKNIETSSELIIKSKLARNSEKYEKFANIFKANRDIFEKKKNLLDKRRDQWKPKIENILNKKAIESMTGVQLSESEYKKLEYELKNTILDFLNKSL